MLSECMGLAGTPPSTLEAICTTISFRPNKACQRYCTGHTSVWLGIVLVRFSTLTASIKASTGSRCTGGARVSYEWKGHRASRPWWPASWLSEGGMSTLTLSRRAKEPAHSLPAKCMVP